jgi:putative ABC transport system permease protein
MLLISAGLLLKSLWRVMNVDPGFDTQNLLTMQLSLPDRKYHEDAKVIAYDRNLIARVSQAPGVKGVAINSNIPLSGSGSTSLFDLEGAPKAAGGREYEANSRTISPNYFDVMRIPLRRGRFLSADDIAGKPHVVVISQSLANEVFPGQDPVGKRINFTYTKDPDLWQVVGVVGDENVHSLDARPTPVVYRSFEQDANPYPCVLVRTNTAPKAVAGIVRQEIRSIDADVPIFDLVSMKKMIADSPSMFLHSFPAYLVGAFATLALVLAAIGIYGLLAYSVAQRTRELGVRMALGAQSADLLRLVMLDGVKLSITGAGIGIIASLISSHAIASLLFGVKPLDAMTFFIVPLVLACIALMASYTPAVRASKIDPMVALRYE